MFLACVNCDSKNLKVINSRPFADHIYRRRKCMNCGHRVSTHEIVLDEFESFEQMMRLETEFKKLVRQFVKAMPEREKTQLFWEK